MAPRNKATEVLAGAATDTPPPSALEDRPVRRQTLSIAGIMAECYKNGENMTPEWVIAQVFTPEVIKEIGFMVAVSLAMDLLKLDAGEKVKVDAVFDHGHSDVSVSDAERIFGELLASRQAGNGKAPGKV